MNALSLKRRAPFIILLLLVPISQSAAQSEDRSELESPGKLSVALDMGYFLPVDDWGMHPYAPGVNQFGGGLHIGGEFQMRVSRRAAIGIIGGYLQMNVDEWEDYTRAQGDFLTASAEAGYGGLLFKAFLVSGKRDELAFGFGPVFSDWSGVETFGTQSYNYDFLGYRPGMMTRFEYVRLLNPDVGLGLTFSFMLVPDGVRYAHGVERTIMGLPMALRLQYRI
jgi:hypothetical protein